MFVPNGTLKSEEKSQDARFGYALAAAPDLNHDGFTDLVVGAPLEDEHRGAVYVYHGDGIYLSPNYKQVDFGFTFRLCWTGHTETGFSLRFFNSSASRGRPSPPPSAISAAA